MADQSKAEEIVSRGERPAGNGRTTLHLIDGRAVTTSRAGARSLREISL